MLPAMYPELNALAVRCAGLIPGGWRAQADAPDSLAASKAVYKATGQIIVWDGASERTIFGDPAVNHAFRAWHDWHHVRLAAPFDREGEYQVYLAQCEDVRALAPNPRIAAECCRVLYVEIMGQLEHLERFKRFPDNQRAFCREMMATGRIVQS